MLRKIKPEYLLLLAAFMVVLASCKKDTPKITNMNYGYYPLKKGMYRIFNADSMRYNGLSVNPHDSSIFQLKDVIASSFTDANGNMAYRIEQYKRKTPNDSWSMSKVYVATFKALQLEEVDNNARRIKLLFPALAGKSWDANPYNVLDSQGLYHSTYTQANVPYKIANFSFDSSATIQLQSVDNFVDHFYNEEIYASKVGLIYLQHDSLNKQVQGITGYTYKQSLIGYSK
jgi:hypothetical protein